MAGRKEEEERIMIDEKTLAANVRLLLKDIVVLRNAYDGSQMHVMISEDSNLVLTKDEKGSWITKVVCPKVQEPSLVAPSIVERLAKSIHGRNAKGVVNFKPMKYTDYLDLIKEQGEDILKALEDGRVGS